MKARLLLFVLVLAILLGFNGSGYANSKTYYVPDDFATIQEAINAASDGDIIAVAEGTYKGNIYFKGKSLTLTSANPDDPEIVANTIIEGTKSGSVVTIDSNSALKGFTITSPDLDCRGIYVKDASPIIENCTIIDNKTTALGGGIYSTDNSSPQITNCVITGNTDSTGSEGISIQVAGGKPQIVQSWINSHGLIDNTTATTTTEHTDQQIVTTAEIIPIEPALPTTEPEVESLDVPYKPGELLVRFTPKGKGKQRSKAEKNEILGSLGWGTIKHEFKLAPDLSVIKLPPGLSVEKALEKFNRKADSRILYAEPNHKLEAYSTFPNDPYGPTPSGGDLWGMHNTGQTGGTADADIDAPEAWDIDTGNGQIIVAVIDTGVDYTHPDLAPNMWVNTGEIPGNGVDDDENGYVDDIYGYDFYNNDGDPMDDHFHGTHCAGTIGAVGNNGEGIVGVCWNVKIMALKFLNSGGGGYTADAIDCVHYSRIMGANLSNNSWGGGSYSQSLKDEINAAGAEGMLFAAAAGNNYGNNNDTSPRYPASYDCESIIAVMATDHNDERSGFSNYGPTTVDLGAPGTDILSTFPTYMTPKMEYYGFSTYYETISGTSMAAPHVAGACALLWSVEPGLNNSEVKNIILQSVDETLPEQCVSGGRLNLFNALNEATVVWRVDNDAPEGGDGRTWETAFKYLQDALLKPSDEIWVAQGIYKPDQGNGVTPGDRTATFQLINGVAIKGGYKGGDNETGDERDIENYQTILSGDLAGNDLPAFVNYDDNSLNVVTGADNVTLDGFIVEGGNGYTLFGGAGGLRVHGNGGMRNRSCSPIVVTNCTFRNNRGMYDCGGGIYNTRSTVEIINCTFIGNTGNAIDNVESHQKVEHCTFTDNYDPRCSHPRGNGGAIKSAGNSESEITNCIFSNNIAYHGGAIANEASSSMTITNCVFAGNGCVKDGGGLFNSDSSVVVTNCTFNQNHAYRGGGVFNLGDEPYSSATLTNCILWDNYAGGSGNEIYSHDTYYPTVTYCDIKGGYPGEGNIDSDPLFFNASNPAGADGIFRTSDDGLRLGSQLGLLSPCIDVADDDTVPITDILGQERVDIPEIGFAIADMGVYEFNNWWIALGGFNEPYDISHDSASDYIYVADSANHRIVKTKLNPDGTFTGWATYGTLGSGVGQFRNPYGIYYDSASDYIYVADGNHRIVKTKIDGTGWTTYGSSGSGVGQFYYPAGIYYDSASEYIYVADRNNNRIVKTKLNPDGTFTGWTTYGTSGYGGVGQFNEPFGIYYDSASDYIYVADRSNHCIVKTKINGDGWTAYGTRGQGDSVGWFYQPSGIYYDSASDYIYVVNAYSDRIVKTKIDGTGWATYGTYGSGVGQFCAPFGIYYDSATGYIYVADKGNNRIVKTFPPW